MKHLLTLTLVAVLGFAVVGCNKTKNVNASATAAQCDPANCDPANCDPSKCASMKKGAKGCDKMGTADCPMGKAKPAAAGDAKSCCDEKAKAKMVFMFMCFKIYFKIVTVLIRTLLSYSYGYKTAS
mgnify:CR=1 FL=1